MSTAIKFEWDSRDLQVWYGKSVGKAIHRALRLAGNRAIRDLQKGSIVHAKGAKNLSTLEMQRDQELQMPSRRAALRDLAWTLFVKGRPAPVAKFPHIDTRRLKTRRGVIVRFGGAGGTQRITGAFVATMMSGHLGVFQREGPYRRATKGRYAGQMRQAISEVFSSRLPGRFGQDVMMRYGDKTFRKLSEVYWRGLEREFGKLKRKGQA